MARALLAAALLLALAPSAPAETPAPLDDGRDRSEELVPEIVQALGAARDGDTAAFDRFMKGWRLPEAGAWLARVYGEKVSKAAAGQYEAAFKLCEAVYHDAASGAPGKIGKMDVEVRRVADPSDADLTHGQSDMLHAMDPRVPLYLVFLKGGGKRVAIEAFVFVDGGFRLFPSLTVLQGYPELCGTNLGQIRIFCMVYESKHGEYPPALEDLRGPVMAEKDEDLQCPADATGRSGYLYFFPVRGQDTPDGDVLAWDAKPHADGRRMVLRFGGERELLSGDDLGKLLEKQVKSVAALLGPAIEDTRASAEKATGDEKARLERKLKALQALDAEAKASK